MVLISHSCKTFQKLGMNLGDGFKKSLKDPKINTAIEDASRTLTRSALEEVLKDSVSVRLQQRLDPILKQLIDSLDIASDKLAENITEGITDPKTAEWLKAQTDLLTAQLLGAVGGLRTELLGENSKQATQAFIKDAVIKQLELFISDLPGRLTTPDNLNNIAALRQKLSVELDSLLVQSIFTASAEFDKNFSPRVADYVEQIKSVTGDTGKRVDETISTTQRGVRNIVGLLLGGVAGLILLWGLLRYYSSTRRYKNIIKVLTKQINEIGNQAEYDKLVQKVRETMDVRGLSEDLEAILAEQKLHEQPEWDDKDQQVLKLISKYLKNREGMNTRGLADADPLANIYDEARELGLEDHLRSVVDRTA